MNFAVVDQSGQAVRTDAAWLEAHWMPFTGNRDFKARPRMIVEASGCYFTDSEGRKIFDGLSGLWCTGLGHGRREISEAVARQVAKLDYSPGFQFGHPLSFELANRIRELTPEGLDYVFFTSSGSEAADTSLKMARAYWRAKGQAGKTRLIGREKGYHGVNFGGISVGGIPGNRKLYGQGVEADHLPHTQPPAGSFHRGMPATGAELADRLLDLIALHDASTIAAVIVEPFAGSAGVLIPPQGYLQRLREICTAHDILLIFDEVITGFGRLGKATASERFGVTPDLITMAKGITNATIPAGAVAVRREVHDAIVQASESGIEFFHGYTYSAHPVAAAAIRASLKLYREEGLFERALALEPRFQEAVHTLADAPHVADIRNLGLVAGIELAPRPDRPGARALAAFRACFERGVLVRYTGDTLALSPPLIIEEGQIDQLVATIRGALMEIE